MKRIMGIDYGDARTGIAFSDLLCSIVGSTTVIHSRKPEKTLQAIVKLAIDKNISLYDAHLRYERAEGKKIDTAKQQQAAAAVASVGSQAAQPPEKSPNPMIDALMAGLQRGLG